MTIKKIPICHHIFHSTCLDSWIKARAPEQVIKCPLCNTEITAQKIRDAEVANAAKMSSVSEVVAERSVV